MEVDQTPPSSVPSFGLIEYLFKDHVPANTKIAIERYKLKDQISYVYRLQYTSKHSGRTVCIVTKGDTFPWKRDEKFMFYLRQLVLSPAEVAREFSKLSFLERRARQDLFLALGKSGNPRVQDPTAAKDTLKYKEYI